ncbi:MAG: PilT/PilU family type 4a pilus ATPase [Pseudomonadota bacterium]
MDREQASRLMQNLLRKMNEKSGSDLFITAGFPPAIKIDGEIHRASDSILKPEQTSILVRSIMNDKQAREFDATRECNFAIAPKGIGRYRVSAFIQQGHVGAVLRTITTTIPTFEDLDLPPILKDVVMNKRGLVIIVGGTGSGKSTTLAAMIGAVLRTITTTIPTFEDLDLPPILKDVVMNKRGLVIIVGGTGSGKSTTLAAMIGHRNRNSRGHIITIEDPVEYVHPHEGCVITHREVGVDTENWHAALKNTLRQAPDVILIGEIRDRETMEYGIQFAETGHLCLATLHANSANQALDRIINFFPEERRSQLLMDLSLNTRGLISQRLIPREGGLGRVAAMEIMLATPLIQDLIFKGDVAQIKEIMAKSTRLGMQTFDQALFQLYEEEIISYEDAMRNADSKNELRLNIKLNSKREGGLTEQQAASLKIMEEEKGDTMMF